MNLCTWAYFYWREAIIKMHKGYCASTKQRIFPTVGILVLDWKLTIVSPCVNSSTVIKAKIIPERKPFLPVNTNMYQL